MVHLKSDLHAFKNPHSGQIEFITATNNVVRDSKESSANSTTSKQYEHLQNGSFTSHHSTPEENIYKMSFEEIMNSNKFNLP